MNNQELSVEEWRKLYELVLELQELAPWEWMCDVDVFGVMHPDTKEIGYCSVLGNNKEFYALGIYPGVEGLNSFEKIAARDQMEAFGDDLYSQRCLMLSFGKRDYVTKKEMEAIKKVGVRFNNRNFWPSFQDFTPGLYPWSMSNDNLRYMIVMIEQAIQAVQDFKAGEQEFIVIPHRILVRVPQKRGPKVFWDYEYMIPKRVARVEKKLPILCEEDEVLARKLKKNIQIDNSLVWEIDAFYANDPVKSGTDGNADDRPFFPYLILIVASFTGYVESANISRFDQKCPTFRRAMVEAVQKSQHIPSTVVMRNENLVQILQPILDIFGIKVIMNGDMSTFDETRDSFLRDALQRR